MSALRLIGLTAGLLIFLYTYLQFRRHRYRKGDFLLGVVIGAGLAAVSLFPSLVDGVSSLFQAPTRLMALAILSNIVLFGLFLFALRQISSVRNSLGDLVRMLAKGQYQEEHLERQVGEVVVVIPAFNEERNLEALLPNIPAAVDGKSVRALVIDDGAQDHSAMVAKRYAIPVSSHAINRGGGAAIKTGFELAVQSGAEIIVTMDADGQHNPSEIQRLVGPILSDEADVVLGNRFAGSYAERGGARHAGIVFFSWLVSLLSGQRVHDCTNGYRAIRASGLASLELREQQFHTAEFIMEAARHQLRIAEVPVSVLRRHEGESKKPPGLKYPLGFAWTVFRVWLRS
jgi:hypothetical protein